MRNPEKQEMSIKTLSVLNLITILLFGYCSKYSKQEYLINYQIFIYEIKDEWKQYNEEDWNISDIQNEVYSTEQYQTFESEFTSSEKMRIFRYDFAYHFYRGDITKSKLISMDSIDFISETTREIIAVVSEFNQFKKDIRTEYLLTLIERMLSEDF